MQNYKITVEYDGTEFFGWQTQKYRRTVQDDIEKALLKIFKKLLTLKLMKFKFCHRLFFTLSPLDNGYKSVFCQN